jgi:O-antigen ligase
MLLKEILFYLSIIFTLASIFALIIDPKNGILVTLLLKPVIDTTWDLAFLNIKLGYVIGVGVPIIILAHAAISPNDERISKVPLIGFWAAYILINFIACQLIIYNEFQRGLDLFFKILNGFIGFYWFQRYFKYESDLKTLLIVMLISGFFPIAVGIFQWLTGYTWKAWTAEGGMRNIGLYHDQSTLKYFVFQTIAAIILFMCYFKNNSKLIFIALGTYALMCIPVLFKLYVKSGYMVLGIWLLGFGLFKKNYLLLIFIAMIVSVVILFQGENLLDEFSSVYRQELGYFEGKVELEQTFAGRWHGWKDTIEQWQQADLLSQIIGSGRYANAYGAHNDFLFALARSGIIGLIAYILLFSAIGMSVLISTIKYRSTLNLMALMLFIMWIVETIGLVPSAYPSFQWFALGFIGLALRLSKTSANHQEEAAHIRHPLLSS